VKLPKQTPPPNVYLTAAQLDMLADEAGPYRSLVLLLGVGGLRWGEAIALRVCDADFLRAGESSCTATWCGCAASLSSGASSRTRTAPWWCLPSSWTHWRRPPPVRAARICSGPRHTAATSVPLAANPAHRRGGTLPGGR